MKLSRSQFYWLATLCGDPRGSTFWFLHAGGILSPSRVTGRMLRTLRSLESREMVEEVWRSDGHDVNGFRITPAGRAALTQEPSQPEPGAGK